MFSQFMPEGTIGHSLGKQSCAENVRGRKREKNITKHNYEVKIIKMSKVCAHLW